MITTMLIWLLPKLVLLSSSTPRIEIPLRVDKNIPFLNLSDINPLCPHLEVIFDSGSSDFWLADSSCSGCPRPSTNCMKWVNQTNMIPKSIHYASGWVKGYQISYELCGAPVRVVCVTKAHSIGHFNSDGVLGAGGSDTGKEFISKLFVKNQAKYLSIFNRRYNKRMVFGSLSAELDQEYLKGETVKIQANQEWNIHLESLSLNQQIISQNITSLVDTGSELISLPSDVYDKIINNSQSVLGTVCSNASVGVSCKCHSSYDILKLPNFVLSLRTISNGTATLTIPPYRYSIWKQRSCLLLVTQIPILGNRIVLGSAFINQFPLVFNYKTYVIEILQIDHSKLSRGENINLAIVVIMVLGVVILVSKVCIQLGRHLDQPNKLVI